MARNGSRGRFLRTAALAAVALTRGAVAEDILKTVGFSTCNVDSTITVQRVDISYNNDNKTVIFDVAGTNTLVQNVTAVLNVTAYGQQIYSNSFDPCDAATFVEQLCPVPAGNFGAKGEQAIPAEFASLVPAIAFQVPDIAAMATLQLESKDTGEKVACIQSQVTNGKTANVPAVSYVAAGIAGAALVLTGISAAGAAIAGGSGAAAGSSAAAGGMGTISPSFTEVFGMFQGMAMNGMLSVNYPQVYRSFAKNFGFSTGLVPWNQLQTSIDGFREKTGGNLTNNSVEFLRNATLVFPDGSSQSPQSNSGSLLKRAADHFAYLAAKQIETSVNGDTSNFGGDASNAATSDPNSTTESIRVAVTGIQAYVNELSIPSANTFMTVLLIVAIVIAAIAVGILLVKVVLEIWALFGNFPESLAGFRKHYWGSIARAITNLILLLYGVWVLYCVFQFTHGDSWAAKALAGATLGLFTAILAFFSWKIWSIARKLKRAEGDASGLYEDKKIWVRYSLFYESYRKDYWWIFVPTIVYMFARGCILAGADGNGMVQTVAQLVIELIMLILLLWSRPYERRSGNVINISIQVVRFLSVVCILVFVEEFNIAQTTQTITGVVLIAIQSALTGILAILIVWNAISACCKQNPHRKRRKEMEKMQRDLDTLTPLDARNSLLKERTDSGLSNTADSMSVAKSAAMQDAKPIRPHRSSSPDRYLGVEPANPYGQSASLMGNTSRPLTPATPSADASLVSNAAPIGRSDTRQPTLPNIGGDSYGYGGGYSRPGPPPQRQGTGYSQAGGYGGGYGQGGPYGANGYNKYAGFRGPPSRGGY